MSQKEYRVWIRNISKKDMQLPEIKQLMKQQNIMVSLPRRTETEPEIELTKKGMIGIYRVEKSK